MIWPWSWRRLSRGRYKSIKRQRSIAIVACLVADVVSEAVDSQRAPRPRVRVAQRGARVVNLACRRPCPWKEADSRMDREGGEDGILSLTIFWESREMTTIILPLIKTSLIKLVQCA